MRSMTITNEIKRFYREISNIIFVIALPVILLIVFGYILSDKPEQNSDELVMGDLYVMESTFDNDSNFINHEVINNNISYKDYYGVAMLIMVTFMATILAANSFCEEYRLKTLNKLIISNISKIKLYWSKFIGIAIVAVFALVTYWIIATVVFDITFASTIKGQIIILLISALNTLTLLMFGAILGLYIKKNPLPYIMPFFTIMMFLGGTFSNTLYIRGISEAMPIYQLRTIVFEIGILQTFRSVPSFVIIELLLFIIFTVLAMVKFMKVQEIR